MADYQGDSMKLDVEEVWEVAAKNFPEMAGAYHQANKVVYQADHAFPSADRTEFLRPWWTLRNCLTTILGKSSQNIEDTAIALREAMKSYAERDNEAAEGLRAAVKNLPDEVPKLPPTVVPPIITTRPNLSFPGPGPDVEASYGGGAPDEGDLLNKARTVDEKLYEAATKELGLVERGIVELVPDSWLGITFDGSMHLTDGERTAPHLRIEDLMGQAVRGNSYWYGPAITNLKGLGALDHDGDKPFGTFRTEVDNARDALNPDTRWGGEASRNFRQNFLNAYEDIASTQMQVVGTLLGAFEGYKRALEDTYRMYDLAMDGTIEACQAIIDGQDGSLKTLGTTVMTAAITLVGGWKTKALKDAATVGFALAGSGLSVTSAASQVGGTKHAQAYVNLYEAIGNYRSSLEEFDRGLARDLGSDIGTVRTLMDSAGAVDIILPRPAFADDHTLF